MGIRCLIYQKVPNPAIACDETVVNTNVKGDITRSTACLDLNIIYGNSKRESDDLRIAGTALLKTENYLNFPFPPQTRDDAEREMFCSIYDVSTCFRGGDIRMNQNPDLTIHHILWIRFHNIVAKILEKLNPCWNYEKVFQEARKINIAVHQWFVYNDLLPQVLGRANMYENRLLFESYFYLYVDDYDPYCSPNVLNEFAMVGLRILHPFITGQLGFFNEQRQPTGSIPLSDCLLKPQITKEKFQPLLTGSLTERAHKMCPGYDPVVTNRMFQRSLKCGLDLIAIDIQRNRDHLVPTYNNLRVYCGLPRANSFDDLHDVMDPLSIERLIESYVSVHDVDAYVGCQLERPVSGAKVGPTANCILTEQFKRGRRCDRFFLEHSNVFTNYQLKEIRSFTVAAFICLTSNYMDTMQADPFAPPYGFNTPIPCAFFYKINWNYWIDPKCFFSGL
uniref:Peroxidase-like n=1 Tax=Diabrotica virgifera virgifera TaxID=50390 RepID=A0A6P7G0S8_DIAVI